MENATMTTFTTYQAAATAASNALAAWEAVKGQEGSTKAMYTYLELHGRELALRSSYRAAQAA